jgi:phosphopantothenoylcysteine decarboxylase/phosphopantothenate--cysteine ligase
MTIQQERHSTTDTARVLVCITGGIAAYKVCEAISTLAKLGVQTSGVQTSGVQTSDNNLAEPRIEVRAIVTDGAQQFITPLTIATLCRHPAYTDRDFWQAERGRPLHIELGEWADVIVIAPLTANTLAKLAYGLADNLLTNTVLASTCPILLAPAMNTDMWEQATVQRNWRIVNELDRYHAIAPGSGVLACDRVGSGRMAEPHDLVSQIRSLLYTHGDRDLAGKQILISAGGTREAIDPVRFIGNPSTGKMGVALARAAAHRGAAVTLVCGPTMIDLNLPGIAVVRVVSADEMRSALHEYFMTTDWLIMAAAVADVRPAQCHITKLAKSDLPANLPLTDVPDLVAELATLKRPHQRIIGFAAQTGDIVPPALGKLQRKGLDAIVANPVDRAGAGFASETNEAIFIDATGQQMALPSASKLILAHRILDRIQTLPSLA